MLLWGETQSLLDVGFIVLGIGDIWVLVMSVAAPVVISPGPARASTKGNG